MRLLLAALLVAAVPAPAFAQEARDNIDALIAEHARANKVPEAFVHRVVKRESNYNARAKGGSALGLMQIKHATARGLGYSGDAAGLYDPDTNLKYGIAYLAGAYRAAKGDLEQAYRYYNRGYYYVAKRLGIEADVPDSAGTTVVASAAPAASAPVGGPAKSANGFDTLFALRGNAPAALSGALETLQVASLAPQASPVPSASTAPPATQPAQSPTQAAQPAAGPEAQAVLADAVEVPLPPRRPSDIVLAAVSRAPVVVARRSAPILEASAAHSTP